MKCQVYTLSNGEPRYLYKGIRGLRLSRNRATIFTIEEGKNLVNTYTHHNLVIAREESSFYSNK